jgi:hypothetical protein
MRRRTSGSHPKETKTQNRMLHKNLLERTYFEYTIQNLPCPEGELFVIDRQTKVARLGPVSGNSNLKQQKGKGIKKKHNPAATLKSKKEKTHNEKN